MLKVKRLHENAIIPTRAHPTDAGLDICSIENLWVNERGIAILRTGLSMEVPEGYEIQIRPRSGLSAKGFVAVLGTVDAGYRGEVMVTIINLGPFDYYVRAGDRIAQAVISRVELWEPQECWELSVSDRGTKGHGSTGI